MLIFSIFYSSAFGLFGSTEHVYHYNSYQTTYKIYDSTNNLIDSGKYEMSYVQNTEPFDENFYTIYLPNIYQNLAGKFECKYDFMVRVVGDFRTEYVETGNSVEAEEANLGNLFGLFGEDVENHYMDARKEEFEEEFELDCQKPYDILELSKVPLNWENNNLLIYCNYDLYTRKDDSNNYDKIFNGVNHNLCSIKNLDLEKDNTIIFGYEIGNYITQPERSFELNEIVEGLEIVEILEDYKTASITDTKTIWNNQEWDSCLTKITSCSQNSEGVETCTEQCVGGWKDLYDDETLYPLTLSSTEFNNLEDDTKEEYFIYYYDYSKDEDNQIVTKYKDCTSSKLYYSPQTNSMSCDITSEDNGVFYSLDEVQVSKNEYLSQSNQIVELEVLESYDMIFTRYEFESLLTLQKYFFEYDKTTSFFKLSNFILDDSNIELSSFVNIDSFFGSRNALFRQLKDGDETYQIYGFESSAKNFFPSSNEAKDSNKLVYIIDFVGKNFFTKENCKTMLESSYDVSTSISVSNSVMCQDNRIIINTLKIDKKEAYDLFINIITYLKL